MPDMHSLRAQRRSAVEARIAPAGVPGYALGGVRCAGVGIEIFFGDEGGGAVVADVCVLAGVGRFNVLCAGQWCGVVMFAVDAGVLVWVESVAVVKYVLPQGTVEWIEDFVYLHVALVLGVSRMKALHV